MATSGYTPGIPGAHRGTGDLPADRSPELLAGPGGRRGARIPPHHKGVARRASGLEATLVDNVEISVRALSPADRREIRARVAGPVALLRDEISRAVTQQSIGYLDELFARGPASFGAAMAGRAVELVGEPEPITQFG